MPLLKSLAASSATPEFRDAVTAFLETGASHDRIRFGPGSPPVKIERTLTKLLVEFADLPIESAEIDAESGCEYFRGEVRVRSAGLDHRVRFEWNCRWKADQLGWTDYFGFPDQTRAAREFGYDCFREWQPIDGPGEAPATAEAISPQLQGS